MMTKRNPRLSAPTLPVASSHAGVAEPREEGQPSGLAEDERSQIDARLRLTPSERLRYLEDIIARRARRHAPLGGPRAWKVAGPGLATGPAAAGSGARHAAGRTRGCPGSRGGSAAGVDQPKGDRSRSDRSRRGDRQHGDVAGRANALHRRLGRHGVAWDVGTGRVTWVCARWWRRASAGSSARHVGTRTSFPVAAVRSSSSCARRASENGRRSATTG